jgi:Spy/CpxP family protein refolding chaperone
MKKSVLIICVTLFFSTFSFAQTSKEGRKKIKALKIAYLTEQLNLTTSEAEKFWPIYNEYNKQQNKKRSSYRETLKKTVHKDDIDKVSEEQAKTLVNLKIQTDKELYELQKKFVDKIVGVIPYKKIIKLQIAEMEFGRKLMRKYKHKRPDSKN